MSEAFEPAVIRQHRGKLAVTSALLVVLTVVVFFSAWIGSHLSDALWANLGISSLVPVGLASTVAAGLSLWHLLQPATLTLDERGFVYRSHWRERHFGWNEVEDFFVLSPEKQLRSPACRAGGRVVSFGRNWERPPEDVVAVLQAAKEKWATPPSPPLAALPP